jgi:hypothetical protein
MTAPALALSPAHQQLTAALEILERRSLGEAVVWRDGRLVAALPSRACLCFWREGVSNRDRVATTNGIARAGEDYIQTGPSPEELTLLFQKFSPLLTQLMREILGSVSPPEGRFFASVIAQIREERLVGYGEVVLAGEGALAGDEPSAVHATIEFRGEDRRSGLVMRQKLGETVSFSVTTRVGCYLNHLYPGKIYVLHLPERTFVIEERPSGASQQEPIFVFIQQDAPTVERVSIASGSSVTLEPPLLGQPELLSVGWGQAGIEFPGHANKIALDIVSRWDFTFTTQIPAMRYRVFIDAAGRAIVQEIPCALEITPDGKKQLTELVSPPLPDRNRPLGVVKERRKDLSLRAQ